MDVALASDASEGYYRKAGPRIGYGPGTDFLTATVSAPLFGRLVAAACTTILGPRAPAGVDFVEIGAERGAGVLDGVAHPFRSARQVGVGEALELAGPLVVFSNELFDAQPFRRFRMRGEGWRELGVSVGPDSLAEVELDATGPLPRELPRDAAQGYCLDAPLAAASWPAISPGGRGSGFFLAFDYGKPWEEIAHATPAGTGRAYRLHSQGNDLLAQAGEQDLTCHVCWDWLEEALRAPMDSMLRASSPRRNSSRGTPGDSSSPSSPRRPRE